jgi:quinol monooxygenase YgiN
VFGLVARFKLKPRMAEDFDRLSSEVLANVTASEPGTVVYAVHLTEGEPFTRVFYEIYRDQGDFEEHEAQEHTRRFLAEREACLDGPPEVTFLTLQGAKGIPKPAEEG